MKVVHVLLTSRFAGTERYVVDLATAQVERGYEVTVILRSKAAQDRPDAIAHRFDPRVRVQLVSDWLFRWPAVPAARRLIQQLRPDIAHAHLGSACASLRGVDVCPRVSTLHIRYKLKHHDHLDGVIAIAPWQMDAVPAQLRAHSVQIDNWTVPRTVDPEVRQALRRAHGIDDDVFLVGALGRVEHSKGLDVLVEAFRKADLSGARLAIVGHGQAWNAVRAQAGEGVVMPGFATTPEHWMAAFDCFVSAARDEPFGLVLLEAMQAGLPIIATATQGARHLADAIARPLVKLEDADGLAAALRDVYAGGRARIGYPMDRFRVEQKVLEIEEFYRGLLR